jgi:ADP-heptose:LPS heptosyltransferase
MQVHTDCRCFDGYKPCPAHKRSGAHCEACSHYDPVRERILVLKLGAAGEVIRCTPILHALKARHPGASIVWITEFPELIPDDWVDTILKPSWQTAEWVRAQYWDLVLSLDKDIITCALARQTRAGSLKGFTLDDMGRIVPADADSTRKWQTGIFDDQMKANARHYVEEIFEICGWTWSNERYILPEPAETTLKSIPGQGPIIGLNTGAGRIWPTRIWPVEHYEALIRRLDGLGLRPVLLGGPDEHARNCDLASRTGAVYNGLKPLREFLAALDQCDVIVTAVTMALHMAIGLGKRIVLFNNIFNRHEFHLHGLGEILEPAVPCLACYKRRLDADCALPDCMAAIKVETVEKAVLRQIALLAAGQPTRPSPGAPAIAPDRRNHDAEVLADASA